MKVSIKTRLKIPIRVPSIIKIPLPTGVKTKSGKEVLELTQEQLDAMVCYKMGFMFVIKTPPYDDDHSIYTRKAVAVSRGKIMAGKADMGIVDVNISSAEPSQIAMISFSRDMPVIEQGKQKAKARRIIEKSSKAEVMPTMSIMR